MIHCLVTAPHEHPEESSDLRIEASVLLTGPDVAEMEALSTYFGDNRAEILRTAIVKGMMELTAMMQEGIAADEQDVILRRRSSE